MIKIGLIGIGRLGTQHLERILASEYFKFVGCYDTDVQQLKRIEEDFNVKCFTDVDELILQCDAISIVSSSESHYSFAEKTIKYGKHVFVEKPICNNLEEAKRLVALVDEAGIKFQVGHVERFNPAFITSQEEIVNPRFIEAHRLSHFDLKSKDTSVVLDIMIQDIDIILHLVKANVKSINASGVAVLSDEIDVANARIEFDNGCVANLTASRISNHKMRKMLFFQKENHITIDFLERETALLKLSETQRHNAIAVRFEEQTKYLHSETVVLEEYDALKEELNSFAECLIFNREPRVTALDGYKSLEVACEILQKIQKMNGMTSAHLESVNGVNH